MTKILINNGIKGNNDNDNDNEYDIIIIGGGLSGLRSLDLLKRDYDLDGNSKFRILLIEARDRVGGRTASQEYNGYQWDIGGQWVGPTQYRVHQLIKEIGASVFPQQQKGRKVLEFQGKFDRYLGTVPKVNILGSLECQISIWRLEYLCSTIDTEYPHLHKNASKWDSQTVQEWIDENVIGEFAKTIIKVSILSVFSVDPSQLSVLFALCYFKSAGGVMKTIDVKGGAQQDRILGGSHQLSEALYNKNKELIKLNSQVLSINYNDINNNSNNSNINNINNSFNIKIKCTDNNIYRCKKVIITIPLPLLNTIEFSPELAKDKLEMIKGMKMGQVIKFIIFYKSCFWRDEGFAGEIVSDRKSITLVYDGSFEDGSKSSLIGFFEGDYAGEWSKKTKEERKTEVMDLLFNAFDQEKRVYDPTNYIEMNWMSEKFTQGGYGAVCNKCTLSKYPNTIRNPIANDNIYFAGTETATEWSGYMEGALQSAERVVNEIKFGTSKSVNSLIKSRKSSSSSSSLTSIIPSSIYNTITNPGSLTKNNNHLLISIFIILLSLLFYKYLI